MSRLLSPLSGKDIYYTCIYNINTRVSPATTITYVQLMFILTHSGVARRGWSGPLTRPRAWESRAPLPYNRNYAQILKRHFDVSWTFTSVTSMRRGGEFVWSGLKSRSQPFRGFTYGTINRFDQSDENRARSVASKLLAIHGTIGRYDRCAIKECSVCGACVKNETNIKSLIAKSHTMVIYRCDIHDCTGFCCDLRYSLRSSKSITISTDPSFWLVR